jgi:hypothetical protein
MLRFGELFAMKSDALWREGNIIETMSKSDYPFGNPTSTSLTV